MKLIEVDRFEFTNEKNRALTQLVNGQVFSSIYDCAIVLLVLDMLSWLTYEILASYVKVDTRSQGKTPSSMDTCYFKDTSSNG